tara:strand:+ start:5102 stop:5578 length:477 start_codon:yes stop_codon:yes gene_type:complete
MKKLIAFIFFLTTACGGSDFDIHDAIEIGNHEQAKELIASRNLNLNDDKICIPEGLEWGGMCPMHHAAIKGDVKMMRLFMENGADIDKKAANKDKSSPLGWAIFLCNWAGIEWLVDNGANLNAVDANGINILTTARVAICDDDTKEKMWEYLEEKGAK